jgi:hypothetical protein
MAGRQRSRTPRGVVSRGDETTDVVAAARTFATFLHKQFLCNKTPAITAQETAALATDADAGGVSSLAAAGASGMARKSLSRDLMRTALRHVTTPEPYFVNIPITLPKSKVVAWATHPVLLPSEVILWLLETNITTSTTRGPCAGLGVGIVFTVALHRFGLARQG